MEGWCLTIQASLTTTKATCVFLNQADFLIKKNRTSTNIHHSITILLSFLFNIISYCIFTYSSIAPFLLRNLANFLLILTDLRILFFPPKVLDVHLQSSAMNKVEMLPWSFLWTTKIFTRLLSILPQGTPEVVTFVTQPKTTDTVQKKHTSKCTPF